MEEYKVWLGFWDGRSAIGNAVGVIHVMDDHTDGVSICLICSEGKPFEADGVTPRCHRVPVADALVAELGPEWSVVHL